MKVGRDLRRLGALPLKNTVYVLPDTPEHRNALQRLARAILERGGEAAVLQSRFAAGLSDRSIEDRFRRSRDVEYGRLSSAARRIADSLRGKRAPSAARRRALGRTLDRVDSQIAEIAVRDWFGAGGKDPAMRLVSLARDLLQGVEAQRPLRRARCSRRAAPSG